ncbi:MAG: urea ABC transporter permease subunit UrtB, partial [Bauldia sp.]
MMPLSYERIVALVFAVGLLVVGVVGANAQGFEGALKGFTKDSFNDTDEAIAAVAASGNPLAARIIEALQDGRLLFSAADGKVYIRAAADAILDAATGKPVAGLSPDSLKPVRINNRLRHPIDAALGGLTLLA